MADCFRAASRFYNNKIFRVICVIPKFGMPKLNPLQLLPSASAFKLFFYELRVTSHESRATNFEPCPPLRLAESAVRLFLNWSRVSSIEHRVSSIEHRASSIQHRASSIQYRATFNQNRRGLIKKTPKSQKISVAKRRSSTQASWGSLLRIPNPPVEPWTTNSISIKHAPTLR
jgi:hypothetical protein